MTARKNDTALAAALAVPHLALLPPPTTADEALALLVHALLVHHGFRAAQTAPPEAMGNGAPPAAVLPIDWGVGGWGGRYKHTRSAREYEIRSMRLGGMLSVVGVAVGEETKPARVELTIDECVVADAVPQLAAAADEKGGKGEKGGEKAEKGGEKGGGGGGASQDSPAPLPMRENDGGAWNAVLRNVADVASRLATGLVYVLIPEAAKDGYEQPRAEAATTAARPAAAAAPPPPRAPPPAYPDDPLRVGPPMRGGGVGIGGGFPFGGGGGIGVGVGGDDLAPAGLGGGLRLPGAPGGVPFGPGGGGGNLMGPGHPAFGGGVGGGPGFDGGPGFGGGPGGGGFPGGAYGVAPGSVPRGARYDPIGPGDVPGLGGAEGGPGGGWDVARHGPPPRGMGRGGGRGVRPGGRGGGGLGGIHPDLESPPPPDMYW